MDYEDWRTNPPMVPPLRMSHVARYLQASGRPETCPFCSYEGSWDFHIQWPDEAEAPEDDPLMIIFNLPNAHNNSAHQCVAITCPQCAHFSLLDVIRIKMHINNAARGQGNANG